MATPRDFIPSPNPHKLQVYSVVAFDRIEDVDGHWWVEAKTSCGKTVAVANTKPGEYQVHISAGDTLRTYRTLRTYSGGEGSDAERVFKSFLDAYNETLDTTRTR